MNLSCPVSHLFSPPAFHTHSGRTMDTRTTFSCEVCSGRVLRNRKWSFTKLIRNLVHTVYCYELCGVVSIFSHRTDYYLRCEWLQTRDELKHQHYTYTDSCSNTIDLFTTHIRVGAREEGEGGGRKKPLVYIDVDSGWSIVLFTRKQSGNLICLANGGAGDAWTGDEKAIFRAISDYLHTCTHTHKSVKH